MTRENTAFCGVTYPTDLGNMNILNVGKNLLDYTASRYPFDRNHHQYTTVTDCR